MQTVVTVIVYTLSLANYDVVHLLKRSHNALLYTSGIPSTARERDRDRERRRQRQTDRQTDRRTDRDTDTDRETET